MEVEGTDPDLQGPPGTRRDATRQALRDAAVEMLASLTLDDVTAFVTVRRLADGAGLSSGAVYSTYVPESGVGGRARSAPQVAARDAFLSVEAMSEAATGPAADRVRGAIADADADAQSLLDILAVPAVATARASDGDDGWVTTFQLLGAVVAPHDPEVGAIVRSVNLGFDESMGALVPALLEHTGRELVDGFDARDFARLSNVAFSGCAQRFRVNPEQDPSLLATMYKALWVALTRPIDARDDTLGHRLAVRGRRPLDADEQEAVRAAVLRVTERAGWPAVTLAKVGQIAKVDDARLAGLYPTRHDLATVVWSEVVDDLERRDSARSPMEPPERLAALVDDIVDAACSQRALVASLLISRLQAISESGLEVHDTPNTRIVDLLAAALSASADDDPALPPPTGAAEDYRLMARATIDVIWARAASSAERTETLAPMMLEGMSGSGIRVPDRWVRQ